MSHIFPCKNLTKMYLCIFDICIDPYIPNMYMCQKIYVSMSVMNWSRYTIYVYGIDVYVYLAKIHVNMYVYKFVPCICT